MSDPDDPDTVWRWGLGEFRDRTASADPTPGGGSAAMATAAVGIGLVLMALRVTATKAAAKDADGAATLEPLIAAGSGLMAELSAHADTDMAVFEGYMAALRLPKGTDAEKEARRDRLAEATMAATEAPLNAAGSVLEALAIADQAADRAQAGIVSDVAAGAALLHGAGVAVLYNVDINLKSIKDADIAADYATSRDHLRRQIAERHRAVTDRCAARLA